MNELKRGLRLGNNADGDFGFDGFYYGGFGHSACGNHDRPVFS